MPTCGIIKGLRVRIRTDIVVWYDHETDQWVSRCPLLDLYSQGDSREEAIRNIQESAYLFLTTCCELGTLTQVLHDCGVQPDPNVIPISVSPDVDYQKHAETSTSQF